MSLTVFTPYDHPRPLGSKIKWDYSLGIWETGNELFEEVKTFDSIEELIEDLKRVKP